MLLAKQAAKLSPIRSNSASLKWLKNAMGAIGVSTKSVLREYSPNVSDAFASGASALRNISKSASNTRVDQAVRNNKYVQIANKAFRNAIDDIKSGNLAGVEDRSMKAMGFDWDNMFNDAPDGGLTFGDEGGGDVNIAYVDASGANDAGFSELANSMNRNTELTLKTGKAQMDAYIAMSSASLQQSAAMNEQVISHLAGIQNNLASLVEYNNTNMNKFIEASMAFYERTGAAMEKEDEGSKAVTASDVVKTGGSLNFSNYKQYIKEQLKKNLTGSQLGPIMSMIDEQTLEFFAANPLSMLTEGVVKLMMPKMFTTTIKGFEQTFSAMLPNMLHRLSEWGEKQSGSMMNRMLGTLAKSFGLNLNEKTNEIDRSQIKIERGAIPFDGETKNAITNIITKELREQTVYLKHIAGHFGLKGKKAKDALAEGSYFDYDSNQFITMKDLDNKILKSITDAIASGFNNTQFNKAMQRGITHAGGNTDEMQSLLNQFYVALESSGKAARFDNGKIPDNIQKMISGFSGSDAAKKNFTALMQQIVEQNPLVMMSLTQGTVNARAARNKSIDEILKNPSASGILHTSTFDGANLDALLQQYLSDRAKVASKAKPEGGGKYGAYSQVDMRGIMERSDLNVEFMQLLDKFKARGVGSAKGVASAIASGDTAAGVASVGKMFTDTAKDVASMLNEHFFLPMRKTLFGEKDESGFSRGGFFSTAKNMIKDMTLETAHQLTGKEYTDSEGKHHEKIDNSVFGSIRAAIHEKFFGKEELDEEGNPTGSKEKKGLLTFITDSVKESFANWHTAMFGELDEKGDKVTPENVTKKMADYLKGKLPKAMLGGLGGGLFGLASGGLLGAMVGGPIGGVAIGTALGLASDSSKFRKWLFGDQELDNGFISKKTQEYFKKNKNPLIAGAVLGGAKGLIGGGGFLGTLVGGPVAGAMLGIATATVAKSKTFHDFLFGDEEGYHRGVVNSFKDIFKATKEANKDAAGLSLTGKAAGMALTGVAAGAITAGVVSKMGLLGSMLTPLGPIGGAMIGLGLSIRAQSDTFKKWLFGNGKNKSDDDYQAGVIGQFTNMLQVHMLRPFKRVVTDLAEDAAITLKHDVLGVIEKAVEPLTSGLSKFVKNTLGKGKNFLNFIGEQAVDKLVSPIANIIGTTIIKPFTKLTTGVAKLTYGVAKQMVTLPFKIINRAVDFVTSPIRKLFSKAFHPIKTTKWLLGKLDDLLDKHLGISFRPLVSMMKKLTGRGLKGGLKMIGKIASAPFKGIGLVGDVLGGVGDRLAGRKVRKRGQSAADAELGDIYERELAAGNVGTDDDGNPLDRMAWQRQYLNDHPELRKKYRKDFKAADKAQARLNRRARKDRESNEKLLLKASGNSRFEDTEENRAWLQRTNPKLFKKLKGEAVDAGMISDTAKMSEEQLGKADPSKMTNDVRKVHLLQQILNVLRGKNADGSDKKNKSNKGNTANTGGSSGENRTYARSEDFADDGINLSKMASIRSFMLSHGVTEEELDGLDNAGLTNLFLSKGFKITDLMGSALHETKEKFKNNGVISSILDMFSGKGYDEGTESTDAGIHVVGETAPEIVATKEGEKVLSGKKRALNVQIADLSQTVKAFLRRLVSGNNSGGGSSSSAAKLPMMLGGRVGLPIGLPGPGGTSLQDFFDDREEEQENEEEREERRTSLTNRLNAAQARATDLAVTADERQAQIAEDAQKSKQERMYNAILQIADSSQKQEKGTSKFHKLWSSIFSKKGIITAGLLALGGVALSFFKNNGGLIGTVAEVVSAIGNVAGKITGWLWDHFIKKIPDAFWTFLGTLGEGAEEYDENNESTNGKGSEGEIEEAQEDLEQLNNGDVVGFIESAEGTIDHRSTSKANALLTGTRKGVIRPAVGVYGAIRNKLTTGKWGRPKGGFIRYGAKDLRSRGMNMMRNAGTAGANAGANAAASVADDVVEVVSGDVIDNATGAVLSEATPAIGTTADDIAGAAIGALDSAADDVAAKNQGLLKSVISTITGFIDDVIKKIAEKSGKKLAGTMFGNILSTITSVLKKGFSKISSRIAKILGFNAGLATTGVGWLASNALMFGLGALNGITGTARLFQINKEDVDHPIMDIISAAFGGFSSTTVGAIADVVNELVFSTTGMNIYNALACAAYRMIVSDEKYEKLETAKDEFHDEYLDYQEDAILEQYNTMKDAGILPTDENGEPITEDAYISGVRGGEYGAKYDSFADYNDKENKSFGGKVLDTLHGAWNGVKDVGGSIKDFLVGSKETYYTDGNGNKYYDKGDGTLDVVDSEGNSLGNIAASDDVMAMLSEAKTKTEDGLLTKPINAVKGFGEKVEDKAMQGLQWLYDKTAGIRTSMENGTVLKDAASLLGSAASDAASWVGGKATDAANAIKDGLKKGWDFFTKAESKTNVYLLNDGSGQWYDIDGVLHDMYGNPMDIEPVSHDELVGMVKSGILVVGEWTAPTGFEQWRDNLAKSAMDRAKDLMDAAREGYEAGQEAVDKAIEGAKDFGARAVDAVGNVLTKAKNYFTKKSTETIYRTTDGTGNYYASSGAGYDLYSATGSPITEGGAYSVDEIESMAKSGILVKDTIEGPTAFAEDVKGVIEKAKDLGQSVVNGFKTGYKMVQDGVDAAIDAAAKFGDKALEVGASVIDKAKNFFFAQKETVYVMTDGSYFAPNEDGTYDHYSVTGEPLTTDGAYTAEDIDALVRSNKVHAEKRTVKESGLSEFVKNVGSTLNDIKKGAIGFFTDGLKISSEFFTEAGEGVGQLFDSVRKYGITHTIKSLLNPGKAEAYFDPQGNYYMIGTTGEWEYYSQNGDLLEKKLSDEEIQARIQSGLLKKGEVKKDNQAREAVKKIQDAASKAWKKAKDVVTSGWESFTNWITGGGSGPKKTFGGGAGIGPDQFDSYGELPQFSGGGYGVGHRGGGYGSAQPEMVNGFPYYAQNDKRWASKSYDYQGDGATLGDSGCGPSVMSMVLAKATGKNVSPVELARFARATGSRDDTGTNWNFIGNTARAAGLNVDQRFNPNAEYIRASVNAGNPVVLSGYSDGGNTPYTSAGHYIVAVGSDANGNIKVNDPRGKAFSRSYKPEELSKYTGSAWTIGKSGGLGRRRRGGGRSGSDVMSKVSGFLSELGTRTVNGLLTGTFDSNWSSYWNPTTTTTTTGTTGSAVVGGSTNLTGNSTTEQIWNYLTGQLGITKEGAAGLMGNMEKESGLIPNNLEDLYQKRYGLTDEGYTASVDNGSYTRDQFINDQFGYGLVQWTKPPERKAGLYDTARQMGVSVGNIAAQLSWLMQELQGNYKGVYDILRTTTDVRQASNAVLHDFENPKYASSKENERYQASMKYYNQFAGSGAGKGRLKRLLNKRRGGRGYTAGDAREAVISWMLAIMNQNYYDQGKRHRVEEGLTGHGYGDCSSTVAWAYKKATGLNIGTTTRDEWKTGTIIQQNTTGGAVPDESGMLPGDLIFFWGSGTSRTNPSAEMSHVEMYIGSGTLAGHGCDWGPFTKNMQEYCSGWKSGYCYVVRYITDENAASLNVQFADPSLYKVQNTFTDGKGFSSNGVNTGVMPGGATSASSGATASTSNSILDKVGGFFSELGTRTMNGLLTGTFDNDWNSYWSGVTTTESSSGGPTDTISTGASSSSGSSYPLYNLDDETKEFVAGVVAGETGGADSVAARQEASQMANLNEVHFKKQPNAESIKATLTSGWYATRSLRQSATDVTRDAVETVMNNGRRTLPRYVTEHDMFPGDIKNAKDRSEYKVGDDVANIYGSKYKFYTFFGRDKKGDIAGYFPKDYEKYQSDVPWGGGAGTGAKLRRRNFSLSHPVSLGGHGEGDSGYKPRIGRSSTYHPKRMGGFGIGVTSTTQTPESIVNSSLMGILQSAEQAKASGNTKAILSTMVELLGLIAENTGMSASAMQRANQLLSELKGLRGSTGKSTTTTSDVGGNTMGKLPEKVQKTTTASTKNMKLAQRIAAGK